MSSYLPPDLFKGTTVLVTGGGSGINLGIAKSFAALGADLAICGRTASRLDDAAAELRALGARVSTTVADVRDYAAIETALAESERVLGPAAVVVCGAAGNFLAPAAAMSSNGFRAVVEIDLLGTFHTSRAAFAQLKETRGCLIFISAPQARVPSALQAHAAAAKAGVDSLMRSLALEWGPFGIRCNSIVPGPIEGTEGMRRLSEGISENVWARMTPLQRLGTTEDVAGIAVVLASPLAAYVTGARVAVDGGFSLSAHEFPT